MKTITGHRQESDLNRSIFSVFIVAALFSGFFVANAHAATINVASDSTNAAYYSSVLDAANRLVETQNTDGGWDWFDPDTNLANTSPNNTYGVTAQVLLDAYALSRDTAYLTAALKTKDAIEANSGRVRGPDVTFLVNLSQITDDNSYTTLAETKYQSTITDFGSGTPAGLAQFVRDTRHGQGLDALISWDVNLYIQGARALGHDADAEAMAEVIYETIYGASPLINLSNSDQPTYVLGLTGVMNAFQTTGIHADKVTELRTSLLTYQQEDGHFAEYLEDDNGQVTAYAILALLGTGNTSEVAQAALWLNDQQQLNGGYLGVASGPSDLHENTEYTSEAGHALAQLLPLNTYYTIQKAVDIASPGDTVNVGAGTYAELVAVNKENLILKGANFNVSPITGSRGAESILNGRFEIDSNSTTIDGFTINNGEASVGVDKSAVYMLADTSGHTISNNILTGANESGTRGVLFGYTVSNVTVDNNDISGWNSGVYINPSSNLTFSLNKFHNNVVGIGSDGISGVQVNENIFDGNTVEGWGASTVGETVSGHRNKFINTPTEAKTIAHYGGSIIDATNNYWGVASGPSGVGAGAGGAVSENVNYRPWLLEADGDTYALTIALTEPNQWALVSAPTLLSEAPTIVDDAGGPISLLAYENGAWFYPAGNIDNSLNDAFKPISAFYAMTTNKGGIGFKYAIISNPTQTSKQLTTGWNLVGTNTNSSAQNEFATIQNTPTDSGMVTLYVPGISNSRKDWGYTSWESDANHDLNANPITELVNNNLSEYDGYWVFMNAVKAFVKNL